MPVFRLGWIVPLLLAAPAALRGAAPPALNDGPMIRLEERVWSFGTARQNDKVTHRFEFRNEGTAPLRILKVDSDCGCTVAMPKDSVLAPGASSYIQVSFSTRAYEGDQQKIIAVQTNDPAEPRIDLQLTGWIQPDISLERRILDFGTVRRGEEPVLSTWIEADKGTGFQPLPPKGGEDLATWTITPVPCDTAEVYLLETRLRPDVPLGRFNERIDFPVKHPKISGTSVAIRGTVYSYFRLSDDRINFVPIKPGKKYTLSIDIQSDGSKPYQITDATTKADFLKPVIKEHGNGYTLAVTLMPREKAGRFQEMVLLNTTDPAEPQIPVEVRGRVSN
jgi:hypothetical protein